MDFLTAVNLFCMSIYKQFLWHRRLISSPFSANIPLIPLTYIGYVFFYCTLRKGMTSVMMALICRSSCWVSIWGQCTPLAALSAHRQQHLTAALRQNNEETQTQLQVFWTCWAQSFVTWSYTFHWFNGVSGSTSSICRVRPAAGAARVKLGFKLHALILPNPHQSFV